MARGEGSGWHRESRRHAEAAKKGRPRSSPARAQRPADTKYQLGYIQDFLRAEERDLEQNNKQYDEIVKRDPFDDAQVDIIDYIQEGRARIDLLKDLTFEVQAENMSNQAFAKRLRDKQNRLSAKAEKLYAKEEALGETNYDEDEFEKVYNARRAAEWQSLILTNVIQDIEGGRNYR